MFYNLNNVVKNHNHTIITAILVAVGCVFGYGLATLLVVGGFWFGREHNQAEMRFMNIHNIYRDDLEFLDGFKFESWNKDSLFNDLILPVIVGCIIYYFLCFKAML